MNPVFINQGPTLKRVRKQWPMPTDAMPPEGGQCVQGVNRMIRKPRAAAAGKPISPPDRPALSHSPIWIIA